MDISRKGLRRRIERITQGTITSGAGTDQLMAEVVDPLLAELASAHQKFAQARDLVRLLSEEQDDERINYLLRDSNELRRRIEAAVHALTGEQVPR